jgi:hypothetical protein
MTNFSIFDYNEEIMLMISDMQGYLSKAKTSCINENFSLINSLQLKLTQLQEFSTKAFDQIMNQLTQERLRSNRLLKHLAKSKAKAKKFFTMQQKLSSQQEKIKLKNRSLTSSLKKLKKFMKHEVQDLEVSLKRQQRTHSRLSFEYQSSLDQLDLELKSVFEDLNSNCSSLNSSKEFERLMLELPNDREDYSRISMEKNLGGWASEFDSSSDSRFENEDIKNAIGVLVKANLIGEENCLFKLNRLLDQGIGEESAELLKQLVDIKAKGNIENLLEDTTPMNSLLINEAGLCQTMVSPGHRGSMFFVCDEDSVV